MILFPISIVASLLYSSLTAGLAIPSSPAIEVISPNITNLADDHDLTHCSSDHASYGQIRPGSVACILAIRDLLQSPKITRLPNVYPMKLLSSTASLPTLGNGFRTPWRSTFRDCTVAIALLNEVPARFTPEAPARPSGPSATILKSGLEQAATNLLTCFKPSQGTNIGWAEPRPFMAGDGRVGIFAFQNGSPIDQAIPDGPRIPETLSSNLTADLTVE